MTLGLIIVNEDPEAAVHWAVGEGGDLKATGSIATLSDVPASVRDAESLMAILPGHMGATRRLTLPVKGEKALEDAARLSFEDVLAEPVEDFHFAFGPLEEDGTRMVSAVPIDWLTAWMDHLKEAELDPDHVTLDHLAIHIDEHPLVLLHQAHQVAA
ncbi:MAG: type II secretion system protein GspL, partial [Pseudomonadota bacterium]